MTTEQIKIHLIEQTEGLTVHQLVRFIAGLSPKERQEIASVINDRYRDVGINESKIIVNDEYVEGYEGNGFCTVNDEDYDDRFLKIYFNETNETEDEESGIQ